MPTRAQTKGSVSAERSRSSHPPKDYLPTLTEFRDVFTHLVRTKDRLLEFEDVKTADFRDALLEFTNILVSPSGSSLNAFRYLIATPFSPPRAILTMSLTDSMAIQVLRLISVFLLWCPGCTSPLISPLPL